MMQANSTAIQACIFPFSAGFIREKMCSLYWSSHAGKTAAGGCERCRRQYCGLVSSPILVAEEQTEPDPGQEKTPEEILKNTSVTLMKNGETRTEKFTQQETSVDVRVKLDDSVDKCWLKICGYAGNTGFDPDSNLIKFSGPAG